MNEKLISGYAAYTSADEFGAYAEGNAPATLSFLAIFSVAAASAGAGSYATNC